MNKCNKNYHMHGYWEHKHSNGNVVCKYNFNNGMWIGYEKWYRYKRHGNGKIRCKGINI